MELNIIMIIVALVLVAIVWKVLKGMVKTIGLLIILAAAAYVVFVGIP